MICQKTEDEIKSNKQTALIVILISFMCAQLFSIGSWFLNSTEGIVNKCWDVNNVTVADFSVQMDVSKKMWEHYLIEVTNKKGMILPFDKYICKELQS